MLKMKFQSCLRKLQSQNLQTAVKEVSSRHDDQQQQQKPEEETIDFQKERQQILQTVQDEFPPILKMMERANVFFWEPLWLEKKVKINTTCRILVSRRKLFPSFDF